MGKPKPTLLRQLFRRLESDLYATPVAASVLGRYRTETLGSKYPSVPKESFPEDRLYKGFYAQYPQAKAEPITLNSTKPSIARQFVQRQLAHINNGMSMSQAFAAVQQEMHPNLSSLGKESISGGYLEFLQQREQQQLEAAWNELHSKFRQQQQQQQQ